MSEFLEPVSDRLEYPTEKIFFSCQKFWRLGQKRNGISGALIVGILRASHFVINLLLIHWVPFLTRGSRSSKQSAPHWGIRLSALGTSGAVNTEKRTPQNHSEGTIITQYLGINTNLVYYEIIITLLFLISRTYVQNSGLLYYLSLIHI